MIYKGNDKSQINLISFNLRKSLFSFSGKYMFIPSGISFIYTILEMYLFVFETFIKIVYILCGCRKLFRQFF